MAGKVALKEGLVDGDILDAHDPPGTLDLDDPVYQQKRVPVRDDVEDPADVHHNPSHALTGAGEPASQRNITLMARLCGHDVPLDPASDQRQIAQNVPGLMADELIRPAQCPSHQAVVREHQGGLESRAEGQSPGPQRLCLT